MKEIKIARICLALIGLCLVAISVLVSSHRSNSISKDEMEQAANPYLIEDDELLVFLMPDGSLYIPAEEFQGRSISFKITPKP